MIDASFSWEDPLLLNEQLTEDERLVHDMVQRFSHEHLMPVIVDWNRQEIFDRDLFLQFGELGLLGGTIEGYGCFTAGGGLTACNDIQTQHQCDALSGFGCLWVATPTEQPTQQPTQAPTEACHSVLLYVPELLE